MTGVVSFDTRRYESLESPGMEFQPTDMPVADNWIHITTTLMEMKTWIQYDMTIFEKNYFVIIEF